MRQASASPRSLSILLTLLAAFVIAGAAAGGSVGDVRVLVVRATSGPTPDNAAAVAGVAEFYARASFGKLRLQLDITPWQPSCTPPETGPYDRVVCITPESTSSLTKQLGRSFGLQDASGDAFSPMGKGTLDFSAYEKLQLGWISAVQRVDRSRTYSVGDIDVPSTSSQALVVTTSKGEYWIEHRSDKPRRVIVRLVPPKATRTVYIGAPSDRFVVAKIFSVTRAFRFTWLDRTRPTQPHLHGLDETVLWWTPSKDRASGIATYRVTVDGKQLTTTSETRIELPELHGIHRFAVVGIDRAGNRSRPGTLLLHIA
jgi:hypothetical protein